MTTLVLDATNKTIVAVMSGAAATTNPAYVVSYADNNGTTFTEGAQSGSLNGTTPVTIVSAPASGYRRTIKQIWIENADTAAITTTVYFNNNGTNSNIAKVTLNVADTWTLNGTFDTNGSLKQTLGTINLTSGVTGTLAVSNGGTGITTVPSNGFVPIGNGTNYVAAALTAGAGISVTNGSGSITIAGTGSTINSQTTGYTLVAGDAGKTISITTGGVTIPNNVMSAGNIVTIYNNSGSSQTITQGASLTLQWAGQATSQTGNRTLGLYGVCSVLFISSSSAVISGAGLT